MDTTNNQNQPGGSNSNARGSQPRDLRNKRRGAVSFGHFKKGRRDFQDVVRQTTDEVQKLMGQIDVLKEAAVERNDTAAQAEKQKEVERKAELSRHQRGLILGLVGHSFHWEEPASAVIGSSGSLTAVGMSMLMSVMGMLAQLLCVLAPLIVKYGVSKHKLSTPPTILSEIIGPAVCIVLGLCGLYALRCLSSFVRESLKTVHKFQIGNVIECPRIYEDRNIPDLRTDFTSLGPVKHEEPFIAPVTYERKVQIFGVTLPRICAKFGMPGFAKSDGGRFVVSLELLSHLAVSHVSSPLSDEKTVAERINQKSNLHSVNLNRYLNIQSDVTGDTVRIAFNLWRAKRQLRQDAGLPFPAVSV